MLDRLSSWLAVRRQGPPFNWPRRRKLRWLVGLVLFLLAYPVLVTLALWTGLVERALKSENLRVEIQNPAYTIWPGKIRMKHVRILANGKVQFILDGQDVVLNLRLLELVRRRVHVTELAAHDVLYQMRVKVKDPKGSERRIAAYPPLPDLPGANVVHETTAEKTEKREGKWTVKVEGLDIAVRELWFFEYRYLGSGHLKGGFLVGPNLMQVSTAVQDVGPGDLRFGAEQTVATGLRGQITANIPQVNPNEHADASFMEFVTARVNLQAHVASLVNLSAYFDGLEISHGAGPFAVDLFMDKGRLGPKSHLNYETESVRVKGNGFGVGTDLNLAFDASGSAEQLPIVRASAQSTYLTLARGRRELTVQIHKHHEEAELDTIQLSRATDLKKASLRMPQIISVDLHDLPAVLLPEGTPISIKDGEPSASLSLDMDHEYWAHGPLVTKVKDLRMNVAGVQVAGNLQLQGEVRFNPKQKINELRNLAFTMRDMGMRAGSRAVDGWWMNVDSKRLTLWNSEPPRFEGTLAIRARDLEPVLKALAEKDVISDLIPMFTSLTDFRASTTIRAAGPLTDVTLASESRIWDAAGRVYKNGAKSQMALVVGGQAVSLGIANNGEHLELMPFAKTDWLNDHLRQFPKPLVQMAPSKP